MLFNFLTSLPSRLWAIIIGIGTLLSIINIAYRMGGNAREANNNLKRYKSQLEIIEKNKEIENEVDRLSDDDVIKQLRDNGWIK